MEKIRFLIYIFTPPHRRQSRPEAFCFHLVHLYCSVNVISQEYLDYGGQRSKLTVMKFLAIMQEFLCYFLFVLYLF